MKKIKKVKLITIVAILAIFSGVSLVWISSDKVQAAAPGCSTTYPTAITGSIGGYGGIYHDWSVNVLIGMDFHSSSGAKIRGNGAPAGSGYSYTDHVNPGLSPVGEAPEEVGNDRNFGADEDDGNGILCVSSKVRTVWFELYPKNESGTTVKTHYGGANDQKRTLQVGKTNSFKLRLPTGDEHGGNTGDVNGYVKYNSQPVNPANLTFRAFPVDGGATCGIEGFSASASIESISSSQNATYYLIPKLAGGQCGQTSQIYKITVKCTSVCGGTKSLTKSIKVGDGKKPRLDFSF